MKKKFVLLGLLLIANNIFASNSDMAWQKYRLLSPTLSELESEVVWLTITNYTSFSDKLINEAIAVHTI